MGFSVAVQQLLGADLTSFTFTASSSEVCVLMLWLSETLASPFSALSSTPNVHLT